LYAKLHELAHGRKPKNQQKFKEEDLDDVVELLLAQKEAQKEAAKEAAKAKRQRKATNTGKRDRRDRRCARAEQLTFISQPSTAGWI
jgi:hypothetical protein